MVTEVSNALTALSCPVAPFLGNDGAREKLHKVPPGFDRAARETGAEIPRTDYQGSERNGKRKGKVTSVTCSDVYLCFSGSTSAMECWECWIFCTARTECSDKPKPSRDTRSCSASRRSPRASLSHPRKRSEPAQQLLPCLVWSRLRDNDLCQIVF